MPTSWTDLIKRGHTIQWSVTVEGIRYVFSESDPARVDASTGPALPAAYLDVVDALVILPGQSVSIEADREVGVARGGALDVILGWGPLEDAGLLDDLFRRPTYESPLSADLDSAAATVAVATTTGSPAAPGTIYIGREAITFTGKTATTFTGASRGVAGREDGTIAYDYLIATPGSYRLVTDLPKLWRGRFVGLHAHLVSPEGRILASTWFAGDYHRVIWRGYVDAAPQPGREGMILRCLPLVRLAAQELGYEAELQIVLPDLSVPGALDFGAAQFPIVAAPAANLRLTIVTRTAGVDTTDTVEAPLYASPSTVTLGEWVSDVREAVETAWSAKAWYDNSLVSLEAWGFPPGGLPIVNALRVYLDTDPAHELVSLQAEVGEGAYWLSAGVFEGFEQGGGAIVMVPVRFTLPSHGWVAVEQTSAEGWQDLTIPSAGQGILHVGGEREIVRWDGTDATFTPTILIRIVERGVGGTPVLAPGPGDVITLASGAFGSPRTVLLTLLESSGTGERGSFDTLGLGFGCGIPSQWISESGGAIGLFAVWNSGVMVGDGTTSIADLVGGWCVLRQVCLVQRADPTTNDAILRVEWTQPMIDNGATVLGNAEVLLDAIDVPRPVDAPNEIRIDRTGWSEETEIVVRDVPRIQAEGPRSWDVKAANFPAELAGIFGATLLAIADGQALIELAVGPWMTLQVGDNVRLTIAHPSVYDWDAGARGPSSVYGRIVGWKLDLATLVPRLTILLAGHADETAYLCPTATATAAAGSTLTLTSGEGSRFAAADLVIVYDRGQEATRKVTRTISSIAADVLTFTVANEAWFGVGVRVTYPAAASATSAQLTYHYVQAADSWEV